MKKGRAEGEIANEIMARNRRSVRLDGKGLGLFEDGKNRCFRV